MPTLTQLRPSGRAAYQYAARHLGDFAVVVIACVVLVVGLSALTPHSFIARLDVANPSEYGIVVSVTDNPDEGWMRLGTAQPNQTTTFEGVYDQGRTWAMSFAYARLEGSITISRADLESSGWRIDIPQELIRDLRSTGVPATPAFSSP